MMVFVCGSVGGLSEQPGFMRKLRIVAEVDFGDKQQQVGGVGAAPLGVAGTQVH